MVKIDKEKKGKNIKFERAKKVLDSKLRLKAALKEEEFERKGEKADGINTGYVAEDKKSKKTHMIKSGKKKIGVFSSKGYGDHVDLGTEYIAAAIAKRLLKRDVPDIGLVVKGGEIDRRKVSSKPIRTKDGSKFIALRSKFFEKFETYFDFNKKHKNEEINIKGLPRILAGVLILGEVDPHAGNIGVVERKGDDGKNGYEFVKIDHGRSLMPIERYFSELMNYDKSNGEIGQFSHWISSFGYSPKRVVKDPEFLQTLKWMTSIKVDEIETLIKKQVYDLHNIGYELDELYERSSGGGRATPQEVVRLMTDNIMSNIDFARRMLDQLQQLEIEDLDSKLSEAQKKALEKGEKVYESTNRQIILDEKLARKSSEAYDIDKGLKEDPKKVYLEFQQKWGKANTGFVSKFFGNDKNKAFQLDFTSESAHKLMNIMIYKLGDDKMLQGKIEIFIKSVQDQKLTKSGVNNAIIEVVSQSNLTKKQQKEILQELNENLGLVEAKTSKKEDKGRTI